MRGGEGGGLRPLRPERLTREAIEGSLAVEVWISREREAGSDIPQRTLIRRVQATRLRDCRNHPKFESERDSDPWCFSLSITQGEMFTRNAQRSEGPSSAITRNLTISKRERVRDRLWVARQGRAQRVPSISSTDNINEERSDVL